MENLTTRIRIFSATLVATGAIVALGAASVSAATTTCSSVGACVLDVNTSSGPGVEGTSSTGEGVLGESFGTLSTTTAVNAGVRGIARTGAYGIGVFGEGGVGAYGRGKLAGVFGEATGTSDIHGFNFGVFGSGQGGVYGFAQSNKPGVIGLTLAGADAGPNAYGVLAYGLGGTPGLFASGSSGIIAQTLGVVDSNHHFVPGAGAALQLETVDCGTVSTLLRGLDANGRSVANLDSSGNLTLAGSLIQHGTPLVATSTTGGSAVMAYGSRTTSPSIEHVGESKLVDGTAFVSLDRGFASTIDASAPYLVFVTPEGDSRGLYVSERRTAGFVVRENAGGRSSTSFEYRILARPLDAMQSQARVIRANSATETATFEVHHPTIQNARPTELRSHLPQ